MYFAFHLWQFNYLNKKLFGAVSNQHKQTSILSIWIWNSLIHVNSKYGISSFLCQTMQYHRNNLTCSKKIRNCYDSSWNFKYIFQKCSFSSDITQKTTSLFSYNWNNPVLWVIIASFVAYVEIKVGILLLKPTILGTYLHIRLQVQPYFSIFNIL